MTPPWLLRFVEACAKQDKIEGRDIILDIVWTAGNHAQAVAELVQRGAERSSSKGFLVG
jgi:hypothetical protein